MSSADPRWELRVVRLGEQRRCNLVRTIGRYQVYRDGRAVLGLTGATAEPAGPATNRLPGCGLCVEPGSYPLATHDGDAYCSIGYGSGPVSKATRKPALALRRTGARSNILVHPGHGFLASLGCINPTAALTDGAAEIDDLDSQQRMIAMLNDLRSYTGADFPHRNGVVIPSAHLVIETTFTMRSR